MAQALNRVTDEEPSVTHNHNQDNLNETWVYVDNYSLEHQPDDT